MQLLSIVIPVYNEAESVDPLVRRLLQAVEDIDPQVDLEVVFVDDGSSDGTPDAIKDRIKLDSRFRLLTMSRNFGHQAAITAGIDHSTGDAVVVMDGDLQDPPEVIPQLVDVWRQGVDVVYAVRTVRDGESLLKRTAAKLHYRLLRWLSEIEIPVDTGDFRLMSRPVVEALGTMRETSRYLRGMVAWLGFSQSAVHFEREARFAGEPKYTYRKLLRLSLDGLTSFTDRPLQIASRLGAVVTGLSMVYGLWIVIARLVDPERPPEGFAAIMVTVLILGGLQLLAIGLLGQYLGRVYTQTKGRPLYVVREASGWPEDIQIDYEPTERRRTDYRNTR